MCDNSTDKNVRRDPNDYVAPLPNNFVTLDYVVKPLLYPTAIIVIAITVFILFFAVPYLKNKL